MDDCASCFAESSRRSARRTGRKKRLIQWIRTRDDVYRKVFSRIWLSVSLLLCHLLSKLICGNIKQLSEIVKATPINFAVDVSGHVTATCTAHCGQRPYVWWSSKGRIRRTRSASEADDLSDDFVARGRKENDTEYEQESDEEEFLRTLMTESLLIEEMVEIWADVVRQCTQWFELANVRRFSETCCDVELVEVFWFSWLDIGSVWIFYVLQQYHRKV